MSAATPSGDVFVTATHCWVCGRELPPGRGRRYCSASCRQAAYRRRHQPTAGIALPARQSRRDGTIYQCDGCNARYAGEQWCPDCVRPCRRLGAGGTCPSCGDPILVEELLGVPLIETTRSDLPWTVQLVHNDEAFPVSGAPYLTMAGVETAPLTGRELAVLQLLAEGLIAQAISHRLGVSVRTVHKHLETVYEKLDSHDRLSAVLRAQQLGIIAIHSQ